MPLAKVLDLRQHPPQQKLSGSCPDAGAFLTSYYLCVLQHALKVIGRFNALEHQGKRGYAAFIPFAVAQTRRMLGLLAMTPVKESKSDFPRLREAFGVG